MNKVEVIRDTALGLDALWNRKCTLGIHPTEGHAGCVCGGYANQQCCDAFMCRKHKCGPRVGCRCPLPEALEV